MATAAGYIRVSTQEQAQHGISLTAQRAKIEAYAALHDLDLREILTDAGASGKGLDRPAMQDLLSRIRHGEIGTVIIFKLDHLTRSPRDLFRLVDDELNPRGIDLVSITENIDTRTPAGRAMLGMMSVFAQMERELIAERISTALQQKKANGERIGPTPYGFSGDPQEVETVHRILRWKRGRWSFGKIARRLIEDGVPTQRGGTWGSSASPWRPDPHPRGVSGGLRVSWRKPSGSPRPRSRRSGRGPGWTHPFT